MTSAFMGASPFPDPSQVFGDPSGDAEGQQDTAGDQGPETAEAPPGAADPRQPPDGAPEQDPIDPEGAILHAIEAGCELCSASGGISSEDFMRFAQGVSFLAAAMKDLQPQPAQPNPADAAAIQADQRQTQADQQHVREVAKMQIDAQQQAQAQAQAASRPAPSQSSARG